MSRAGIVTVAGKPNAGKSTLLNRLVGEKLAITSNKPQSTRHRVVGIRTEDETQMVILDTPGLLEPKDLLHKSMLASAIAAVRDADVIVYVIDSTELHYTSFSEWLDSPQNVDPPWPSFESAAGLSANVSAQIITVLNKTDLLSPFDQKRLAELDLNGTVISISALEGNGFDRLVSKITEKLPESPYLYPADEISTLPLRFFCAEFVRESVMEQLGDELPHAIACTIDEFREGSSPLYIRAVLYVERDSQKGIVIGAGGQQIRSIGHTARKKIEKLLDQKVFLDLWVKVLPNWRKKRSAVARLGYSDSLNRRK